MKQTSGNELKEDGKKTQLSSIKLWFRIDSWTFLHTIECLKDARVALRVVPLRFNLSSERIQHVRRWWCVFTLFIVCFWSQWSRNCNWESWLHRLNASFSSYNCMKAEKMWYLLLWRLWERNDYYVSDKLNWCFCEQKKIDMKDAIVCMEGWQNNR